MNSTKCNEQNNTTTSNHKNKDQLNDKIIVIKRSSYIDPRAFIIGTSGGGRSIDNRHVR